MLDASAFCIISITNQLIFLNAPLPFNLHRWALKADPALVSNLPAPSIVVTLGTRFEHPHREICITKISTCLGAKRGKNQRCYH